MIEGLFTLMDLTWKVVYGAIISLVVGFYVGKYRDLIFEFGGATLRAIRRWPKGPNSWSWCVMLPVLSVVSAYGIVYGTFWAVIALALLLVIHTEASLPGVVNLRAVHHIQGSISVVANLEVVSPPWFTVSGKEIPNPKYALRKAIRKIKKGIT